MRARTTTVSVLFCVAVIVAAGLVVVVTKGWLRQKQLVRQLDSENLDEVEQAARELARAGRYQPLLESIAVEVERDRKQMQRGLGGWWRYAGLGVEQAADGRGDRLLALLEGFSAQEDHAQGALESLAEYLEAGEASERAPHEVLAGFLAIRALAWRVNGAVEAKRRCAAAVGRYLELEEIGSEAAELLEELPAVGGRVKPSRRHAAG